MQQIDSTSHSVPYGMINLDYRTLARGTIHKDKTTDHQGSLEPNSSPGVL
jgi:hypothetical protein